MRTLMAMSPDAPKSPPTPTPSTKSKAPPQTFAEALQASHVPVRYQRQALAAGLDEAKLQHMSAEDLIESGYPKAVAQQLLVLTVPPELLRVWDEGALGKYSTLITLRDNGVATLADLRECTVEDLTSFGLTPFLSKKIMVC